MRVWWCFRIVFALSVGSPNVGSGLRSLSAGEQKTTVDDMLTGWIYHYAEKHPHELVSGGQQQRVSWPGALPEAAAAADG